MTLLADRNRIRCAYVFSSRRRCSNTAMVGDYCRTHATDRYRQGNEGS